MYEALLGQHPGADKLLIWLGTSLDDGSQAILRRFLEGGGRLLMASRLFSAPFAEGIDTFMAAVFYTEIDFRGNATPLYAEGLLAGTTGGLQVDHAVLHLGPEAVPLLRDEEGEVAGLYVKEGPHRAIYLPFDLKNISREPISALLAATLPLLHGTVDQQARLLLRPGDLPALLALRPFSPQAVVVNAGAGQSEAFRLGYQIRFVLEDVDGDGDVDLLVANVQGGSRLYRNPAAQNH